MQRDWMGRLHCDCGRVMKRTTQEFPDSTEEFYWCRRCFVEYGADMFELASVLDKKFPDWNKQNRERLRLRN